MYVPQPLYERIPRALPAEPPVMLKNRRAAVKQAWMDLDFLTALYAVMCWLDYTAPHGVQVWRAERIVKTWGIE